MCHRGLVEDEV